MHLTALLSDGFGRNAGKLRRNRGGETGRLKLWGLENNQAGEGAREYERQISQLQGGSYQKINKMVYTKGGQVESGGGEIV